MTPPLLLLDVDGVLNVLRPDLPADWASGDFLGYTLTWDPSVTARLRSWHETGRVELQWLTTWAANADALLAEPMGLPRGLRVHAREDGAGPTGFAGRWAGEPRWWKLTAARAVAAEEPGRRVVWIDDDLADQAEDADAWLTANPQVLVVAPDLAVGLTHAHLDGVQRWLDLPAEG